MEIFPLEKARMKCPDFFQFFSPITHSEITPAARGTAALFNLAETIKLPHLGPPEYNFVQETSGFSYHWLKRKAPGYISRGIAFGDASGCFPSGFSMSSSSPAMDQIMSVTGPWWELV